MRFNREENAVEYAYIDEGTKQKIKSLEEK